MFFGLNTFFCSRHGSSWQSKQNGPLSTSNYTDINSCLLVGSFVFQTLGFKHVEGILGGPISTHC